MRILKLLIVLGLFLGTTVMVWAQTTEPETHETPFGTMIIFEIKRVEEPNLVCYGLVSELGNKLVGCELR